MYSMSTNILFFFIFCKFSSGATTDKLILLLLSSPEEPFTRAGSLESPRMQHTETFICYRDSERMNVLYLETFNPSELPRCRK